MISGRYRLTATSASGRHLEVDRVAQDRRAGRHGHRSLAAEGRAGGRSRRRSPSLRRRGRGGPRRSRAARVPYSFESSTRTRLPPRLTRAICRTVWLRSERGTLIGTKKSASHQGCGLVAQVAIQSPASLVLRLRRRAAGPNASAATASAATGRQSDGASRASGPVERRVCCWFCSMAPSPSDLRLSGFPRPTSHLGLGRGRDGAPP